jgi:CRISPR-associated protein Csx17
VTTREITKHLLPGLRPEPLASYLAGLGLIRLLGEQADPDATAAWNPDGFVVGTTVPDLGEWLTDAYVPTPVVSPWNGGSGFGAKDKEPVVRIAAVREHPSPRLEPLREALRISDAVVARARANGWISEDGVKDKGKVVLELRNNCPDELLPWIDASIVLAGDDTYFPPLLGTGGNDGRLDFSTNFHQQLLDVLGTSAKGRARSLGWAWDLLAGSQDQQLGGVPVGQFDPGSAGGPGSSQFGAAGSLANPWSYILCFEGAMLFAASSARRNQHGAGRAAMPFTVNASPDGSASGAPAEESRGEVWVPVWRREFTLPEIRQLFAEARASWRGRPARQAVDFYAAVRSLGVARGIDEFTRFGLQRRNGLAFAAVPIDHVKVREEPAVQLAADVEDWVSRVGSGDASTSVGEALRGFRKAHLEFARLGDAMRLATMLAALTTLEMAVGRSGRAKDAVPVRNYVPPAEKFLAVLRGDGNETAELRVAVGLASCATRPLEGRPRTMRQILLPVDPDGSWRDAPLVPGFGARPLADVLADVLIWRSRAAAADQDAAKYRGVTTFRSLSVPAADLHALATGELDLKALDLLLRACLSLNWRGTRHDWAAESPGIPVTTLGLLHPLAVGIRPGGSSERGGDETSELVPALAPDWAVRLSAGQVRQVHDGAAARLLQAGWTAVTAPPVVSASDGKRIAAALVPRCLHPRAVLSRIAIDITTPAKELS